MSLARGQILYDGFTSVAEGMDAATPADSPEMAARTALAVNCVHRGGYVTHRPAFTQLELRFESGEVEEAFNSGVFQGATVYYPDREYPRVVLSVGGRLFEVRLAEGNLVRDISIEDDYDNSYLLRCWFIQAEKWLIKQNGLDKPLIFDGSTSRRPGPDEIKPGTCGAYAWGRIWYALPDGRRYRATDIAYGNGNRSDVLKETECEYLQGADFVVPASCGAIRAIVVPALLDNATGQGPVHIFTDTAVFSCNAPLDRDVWLDMTNPIQTISQNQHGALSDWGCVVVNGDIFLRSIDGIRSYAIARRNFGGWANTPISREIEVFIRNDNREFLDNASGALWDNRLLMTCAPRLIEEQGIVHGGLVVMDFDPIASFRQADAPVWDGLWTGLDIHQVLALNYNGVQRCILISRSRYGYLQLWEITNALTADAGSQPIEWMFASRQMSFGAPFQSKRLGPAVLWADKLKGQVTFDVKFKVDDHPLASDWHHWSECAVNETCGQDGQCVELENRPLQYRPRMRLPQPGESCNAMNDEIDVVGRKFQVVIGIRGSCRIKSFIASAWAETEIAGPACGEQACTEISGCEIDPFDYKVET